MNQVSDFAKTGRVQPLTDPMISVRHLWKLYGAQADSFARNRATPPGEDEIRARGLFPAVRDVSLDVHEGETLIVMGLSGSGKSTLLRCVSKLIEPSFGEVIVDGCDMMRAGTAELIRLRRHKMGMVFQHYALLPHRTVLENVALPLEIRGEPKAAREARALEMIALVGLGDKAGSFPAGLSGGQQQRVGIARSLAVDPDIWFLDEPFSALDPLIRRELQDEFIRLQQIMRKTILFVTHDFDEAIRLANRIAIMESGRVVQIGTPEELVLHPADDYVASFTEHVNLAQVVTVGSIMTPGRSLESGNCEVPASARLADVAERIMQESAPVRVVDDLGDPVGTIAQSTVLTMLLDRAKTV
jgi:glycine betaine/proline transport system ATP-binding protein